MSSSAIISTPSTPITATTASSRSALPSTPAAFSIAALKPHLPRHTAIVRLKTNAPLLVLYLWIWLWPTYYRSITHMILLIASIVKLDGLVEWLFSGLEFTSLVILAWNTFEAVYSLYHPEAYLQSPTKPSRPNTPSVMSPAQRRLKGAHKQTPVFSPSPLQPSKRIAAVSFTPSRSASSFASSLTTPTSLSKSFSASQLGLSTSSLSSSLSSSYLGGGLGPSPSRMLDTSDVNRIMADFE
ncbi:hypothetical protein FRB97_002026 [Tulasnella sp. 331]|nr:hypothetical protein FRB97_002026 [Tulasnella sp. 331]KAG8869960.1 hypothetical protein FRB98_002052 [Tulasnella sp. 332]